MRGTLEYRNCINFQLLNNIIELSFFIEQGVYMDVGLGSTHHLFHSRQGRRR